MNTFIPQTGGHDLRLDDFVFMQNGYAEAFAGLISALSPDGNCVLSGLDETYIPGYSLIGGGTFFGAYQYTPGFIAFQPYGGVSEIFRFVSPQYRLPGGGLLTPPVNGLIFPPTAGDARRYLKIVQVSAGSPSDPVPYADTTNKNVHMLRTMTIKWFEPGVDVPGVDGVMYSGTTGEYGTASSGSPINWVNTNRRGIVEEFYPFPHFPVSEENLLFDANGLGMYRMRGYAICNGNSHNIPNFVSNPFVTPDLRGKFTVMPSTLVGSTIASLTGPAVAAGAFDTTTGFWSGSLTPGTVLGITSYGLTQANLPNCNFHVTENTHTHNLPDLTHSHSVVARLDSRATGGGNGGLWIIALGNDDVAGTGKLAGTDPIGTSSYRLGTAKIIPGETTTTTSWQMSSGNYDLSDTGELANTPPNPIGNRDQPGQGFVKLNNPNPTNAPTSTANITANTIVTSGGSGIYTLNIPPAYAMIKICRLW